MNEPLVTRHPEDDACYALNLSSIPLLGEDIEAIAALLEQVGYDLLPTEIREELENTL